MLSIIVLTYEIICSSMEVMESGNITQSGSYKELLTAGTTAFEQLVVAHRASMALSDPLSVQTDFENISIKQSYLGKENSDGDISIKPGGQLTTEEEKEVGDVVLKPFMDYISVSKGFFYLVSSIASQACFVALQATASYWLAFSIQSRKFSSILIVSVYTVISALSAFFIYLRTLMGVLLGLRASESFFTCFTNSIFKAPMLFFDSTPVGRILTRVRFTFILSAAVS